MVHVPSPVRSGRSAAAAVSALVLAAAVGGACLAQTHDAPRRLDPDMERGAQLAQDKCSACHAVALEAKSPERIAPQFRVLSRLYSREQFAAKLEGIAANGHFEMPAVAMSEDEIADLSAYLASLDGGAEPRRPSPNS